MGVTQDMINNLEFANLVNQGVVWRAKSVTTAAVIAPPTTASIFTLQNFGPDGGLSYVILDIFATCIAAPATLNNMGIMGVVNNAKVAAATASVTPFNMKARAGTYGGNALLPAPGANVVDTGWSAMSNSVTGNIASLPGMTIYQRINGLIVIPAGGMFGLTVIANAAGVTVQLGATWAEVKL
jgi:hypothetical protein